MPAIFRMRQTAVLLLAVVSLFVIMSTTVLPSANAATRADRERHALRVARHQIGDSYRYGSDGPGHFDCSGLTYYAFHKKSGFRHFPRTSSAQAHFARHIKRHNMRKGDLIFFTSGGSVYHVGIFAGWKHGHRMVLHAPHSGSRVKVERMWTNGWFPGTLRH
jgi:cell wall-associated NlpC family hydrolase